MNRVPAAQAGTAPFKRHLRIMHLIVAIAVLAFVFSGLVFLRDRRREAECERCTGNLQQIGLALHEYHDAYGAFPPAYVADAQGKPMHSWRMLIMPYLENTMWYAGYDWNEPWNGVKNQRLLATVRPSAYFCPLHTEHRARGLTSYLAVVGRGSVFPPAGRCTNPLFVPRGAVTQIMVVESADSDIPWMEPRDLDIDQPAGAPGPHISSPHPGPSLLRIDGSVERAWRGVPNGATAAAFRGAASAVIPDRSRAE
jgi:hypothetical protein